jgi:hypothetical protein
MLTSPLNSTSQQEMTETPGVSRLMNLSLLIGIYFIMLLGFILLITTTIFLLGFNISIVSILLSIVFSFILLWIATYCYFKRRPIKTFFLLLFIIISILLISNIFSSMFYDTSYDGQWYHQIAIMKLIDGWNPIYQTKTDQVSMNNSSEFAITQISRFPKGSWICAATFFKLTNNLESCKSINLLLIIASFFLSLAACLSFGAGLSLLKSLIISSLVALNPVSICQSLSFYVDGQLSSTISCIFALLVLLYRRPHWLISLALSMCLIILINLKFTGIVYALVLGVGFSALFMFLREKLTGIKVMHAFSLGIVLGTFFVGYNPYVINTLSYANPFYPILSHDMVIGNRPAGFNDLNRFARFGKSVLSTSNLREPAKRDPVNLKVPFIFSLKEIMACQYPDLRTGGFGPFFGGVFLLAIVALPLSFAYGLIGALEGIAVVFILFLSAFSTTESWWARYAPQIWLVPVISIILMLYNDKYLMSRILGWSLCVILSINILLIGTIYFWFNTYNTFTLHRMLTRLAYSPLPVHVYFEWPSAKMKFRKMGIRYEEVASPKELRCSEPITIPFINAKVCQE